MAKKNGNGEGGISRHKGSGFTWPATRCTPPRDPSARRSTARHAGRWTRSSPEPANRDDGLVFDTDNLTVGRYLERWLTDSVRDTVKATTYESYERLIRLHLVPTLGRLKLKNLTTTHVRGLYREKLDHGLSHLSAARARPLAQGTQAGGARWSCPPQHN